MITKENNEKVRIDDRIVIARWITGYMGKYWWLQGMKYNIILRIIWQGCETVTELGSYKVVTGCIIDKLALRW